jgi:hypothetical protein
MRNEEVSAVSGKKYGPVAQWIEQRFPKPLVGGSTPPGAPILFQVQPGDMGYRMYRSHG